MFGQTIVIRPVLLTVTNVFRTSNVSREWIVWWMIVGGAPLGVKNSITTVHVDDTCLYTDFKDSGVLFPNGWVDRFRNIFSTGSRPGISSAKPNVQIWRWDRSVRSCRDHRSLFEWRTTILLHYCLSFFSPFLQSLIPDCKIFIEDFMWLYTLKEPLCIFPFFLKNLPISLSIYIIFGVFQFT